MPENSTDVATLLKRLEILKNSIALQDTEDIDYQAAKIKKAIKDAGKI